jgi:hypothetical protein
MSTNVVGSKATTVARVDMKVEVVVIPVSDVDRAKSSTGGSGGGRTKRRPALSSSRRRAPGARSNSARSSRRPRPAQARDT